MPSYSKENSRPTLDEDSESNKNAVDKFFSYDKRIKIIVAIFIALVVILFLRLFVLQVVDAEANKKEAVESRTITYTTSPKRGTIYDRNGNVLAVSKEAKTIYANPQEVKNDAEMANKIAGVLGGESADYKDVVSDKSKKFAYIKRKVDVDTGNKIKDMHIEGIYMLDDTRREYPYGQVAGQIVGGCNIDGDGLSGLELYYDDILRGSSGRTVAQQGQAGMPIPGGVVQQTDVIDGQDIMISVDIELQQKLEEYLTSYGQKWKNETLNATVVDPISGEILAAASLPLFNPVDMQHVKDGATEVKCISSVYEPGSTFKTVSATSILENGVLTPDDVLACPAQIQADEYFVSDAHERSGMNMDFRKIIADSSNVGMSLATERMGFNKLYDKILRYKFNEKSGIDFPGDNKGYLSDVGNWSKIQSYNVSFGQGISVTPMQLVRFYSALANNGLAPTPHFLTNYLDNDKQVEYKSVDIIDNKQAINPMISMLRSVVTDGTGQEAEIPGYGVVGKTGTAEFADNNGKYVAGVYNISFVGFLSQASQPLLCYVGGEKLSDITLCPMFKDIMQFAIERFKIVAKG